MVGKRKSSTNTCQISVDAEDDTNYMDSLLLCDNFTPTRSSSQIQGLLRVLRLQFAVTSVNLALKTVLCLSFVGQRTINI